MWAWPRGLELSTILFLRRRLFYESWRLMELYGLTPLWANEGWGVRSAAEGQYSPRYQATLVRGLNYSGCAPHSYSRSYVSTTIGDP